MHLGWLWLGAWVVLLLVLIFFPNPEEGEAGLMALRAPLGVLLLVCTVGKLLYDTLFYSRFRP